RSASGRVARRRWTCWPRRSTRPRRERCGAQALAAVAPLLLVLCHLLRGRLRLLGDLGNRELILELGDLRVEVDGRLERLGHLLVLEDRLPRALRLADAAVDALL